MSKMNSAMDSQGAGGIVPLISLFVLAVLMLLPLGTGASNVVMPNLVLIGAFYWLSSRPLLLPYGACAAIGFWLDLWLDVPLGLNMLLLLVTRLFVLYQLKHYKGRNRLVQWLVFGVLSFGLSILSWLLVSIVNTSMLPIEPLSIQWLVTAFCYAPIAFLLSWLRRMVL